jgi:predicted MFS family arabinose efflux permease
LWHDRNLAIGNVTIALVGALMFAIFFVITLYMQYVRGYSPLRAGLTYLPIPAATFTGTQLAPRLLRRIGPTGSLLAGLLAQVAGLAWWASVISPHAQAFTEFLMPAIVWGIGVGVCIVSAFVVCTMGLTPQIAGVGVGLATATNQVGGAIGLALLAAVAASRTSSLLGGSGAAGLVRSAALSSGYAYALWTATVVAVAGAVAMVVVTFKDRRGRPGLQTVPGG